MLDNDGKLDELARKAIEAFNALTPEEQAAHRREQAISWVWGQLALKYDGEPPISRERISELYDREERR